MSGDNPQEEIEHRMVEITKSNTTQATAPIGNQGPGSLSMTDKSMPSKPSESGERFQTPEDKDQGGSTLGSVQPVSTIKRSGGTSSMRPVGSKNLGFSKRGGVISGRVSKRSIISKEKDGFIHEGKTVNARDLGANIHSRGINVVSGFPKSDLHSARGTKLSSTQVNALIDRVDKFFPRNNDIKEDIKRNLVITGDVVHINEENLLHTGLSVKEKTKRRKLHPVHNYIIKFPGDEYHYCRECYEVKQIYKQKTLNITKFNEHLISSKCLISKPEKELLAKYKNEHERPQRREQKQTIDFANFREHTPRLQASDDLGCPFRSSDSHNETPSLFAARRVSISDNNSAYRSGNSSRMSIGSHDSRGSPKPSPSGSSGSGGTRDVCSKELVDQVMEKIMTMFIMTGFPFNMYDKKDDTLSPSTDIIWLLKPSFVKHIPPSARLGGECLNDFYC